MKKLLNIVIVVALYILLFLPIRGTTMASSLAKVTFSDVIAYKGNEIEIIVMLSNCQEIKSMAVVPLYDSDRLEYISGAWLLKDALMSDWNQDEQNGVILYSSETNVNGEIAKFVLRVTDNASWDDIDFSCKVVLKNGNNSIDVEVEKMQISIACNHEWDCEVHKKNSTCFSDGYTYRICTICNRENELSKIEKTAHTISDWIIDQESTLNEEGVRHKECIICHEVIEEDTIPVIGQCHHIWGEELFVKNSTYSEFGMIYKSCEICGENLNIIELEKLGMKPWCVAIISISTGVATGLIAFLITTIVFTKRKK